MNWYGWELCEVFQRNEGHAFPTLVFCWLN